jgi:hypothetical protein
VIRPAVLAALVCLLLVACGGGTGSRPTVVAWIDATGSAKGDSIALCTRRAREVTRQVASEEGVVAVERLDAATANAPTFRATRTFDIPEELASDPSRVEDKHDEDVDSLFRQLAPTLAAPPAGSTDVVGALNASGARLRHEEGSRFVYLCGDLGDRRLLKLDRLDRQSVSALLKRMKREGDVPKLYGAKVVLDTTSAVARDDLGPAEQGAMEDFYRGVVELGGGDLAAYGTGVELPLK